MAVSMSETLFLSATLDDQADIVTRLGLFKALDGGLGFSLFVIYELKLIILVDVVIKICDVVAVLALAALAMLPVGKCPQPLPYGER